MKSRATLYSARRLAAYRIFQYFMALYIQHPYIPGLSRVVFQPHSLLTAVRCAAADIYRRRWKIKHVTSSRIRGGTFTYKIISWTAISRAQIKCWLAGSTLMAVPAQQTWGEASPKRDDPRYMLLSIKKALAALPARCGYIWCQSRFHRPDTQVSAIQIWRKLNVWTVQFFCSYKKIKKCIF
jgi:hypothetical protein